MFRVHLITGSTFDVDENYEEAIKNLYDREEFFTSYVVERTKHEVWIPDGNILMIENLDTVPVKEELSDAFEP